MTIQMGRKPSQAARRVADALPSPPPGFGPLAGALALRRRARADPSAGWPLDLRIVIVVVVNYNLLSLGRVIVGQAARVHQHRGAATGD